jgi:hypothetical protein
LRTGPSVPILKFLCTLSLDGQGAAAEASDRCEDVVGGLGPAEGLWVLVAGVDVGVDGCFQLFGGAMGAALNLLLGQQREEALDLVDPVLSAFVPSH